MPTPNKSLSAREIWKLLRTKTGDGDDDDWVGTNTPPADEDLKKVAVTFPAPLGAVTQICISIYCFDASGDVVYDATTSMTVTGIEVIDRSHPRTGAGPDAVPGVQATAELANVPLQGMTFVPQNGAENWTLRITDITNPPATADTYQVWYREYHQ
jgi:hypothetical protein